MNSIGPDVSVTQAYSVTFPDPAKCLTQPRTRSKHGKRTRRSQKTEIQTLQVQQSAPAEVSFDLDGFQKLFSGAESEECVTLRRTVFREKVKALEEKVGGLLFDRNLKNFSQVVAFIDRSYPSDDELCEGQSRPFNEVPTGLIFPGVDVSDHHVLFQHLVEHLQTTSEHRVAMLASSCCGNIKSLMKRFITQLMGVSETDEEDGEDETKDLSYTLDSADVRLWATRSSHGGGSKCPPYSIQLLESWFTHLKSLRKVKREERNRAYIKQKLVVVIEDFECFPPDVLETFVNICSNHSPRLPIVLLFGVAAFSDSVHQTLSQSALSLLKIEKFGMSNSESGLDAIIDEVLVNPKTGLKLSHETLHSLLHQFFRYERSLTSFKKSIKYAMMKHYYSNPLCILTDISCTELGGVIDLLSHDHFEYLRTFKSFQNYVEAECEKGHTDILNCLMEDTPLRERLADFLHGLEQYHTGFAFALNLLNVLQTKTALALNAPSVKKSKRTLYLNALEMSMTDTESFEKCMKLFVKLDVLSCRHIMAECFKYGETCNQTGALFRKKFAQAMETIEQKIREEDVRSLQHPLKRHGVRDESALGCDSDESLMSMSEGEGDQFHSTTKSPCRQRKDRRRFSTPSEESSRMTRQAKSLQLAKKMMLESQAANADNEARAAIVGELIRLWKEFFSETMPHYSKIPFSELVYYSNTAHLKKAFNAQNRAAIDTALTTPAFYLDCNCCASKNGLPPPVCPRLPDTSIVYRLYLNCGRMINAYDWLVAFGAVIENEGNQPGQTSAKAALTEGSTAKERRRKSTSMFTPEQKTTRKAEKPSPMDDNEGSIGDDNQKTVQRQIQYPFVY